MIVIIDYGMGNLGSIKNMLNRINQECVISSDHDVIKRATKLILPGVGSFDKAMDRLESDRLIPLLDKKVLQDKCPILGICLGMQLLSKRSEEGKAKGLGWIDAETIRFNFSACEDKQKVPHMGWNTVDLVNPSPLFASMSDEKRFYFVHSFHVVPRRPADGLTKTCYGIDFISSVANENIFGVQFHPEKSHKYGMKLLANFSRIEKC